MPLHPHQPAVSTRTMKIVLAALLILPTSFIRAVHAQAPATTAPASGPQRGTVKAIDGSIITLATDSGKQLAVTVAETVKVLQIAPGSTDLKTAQPIQFGDIAIGDRVLISGKPAEAPDTLIASRVIVMKSTDIAQRQAAQQADWQRRGSGGIVSTVDPATGAITVTNGARKTTVDTTSTTIFRRYAGDSIKFEDAQPGTIAQLQPGDQVRVRGAKSEDGTSIAAEEIVSGTFRNLSGTVASIDASAGTVTLKDLATKKTVVVKVTANSDFRKLPPQAAAMLAARARGGQSGAAGAAPGSSPTPGTQAARPAGGATAAPSPSAGPGAGNGSMGSGQGRGLGMGGAGSGGLGSGAPGAGGGRNMDLAQMLTRFPTGTLAELKPGDALMIVASQSQVGSQPGAATITAITMLSGVEPILAASPSGAAPAMTISPWNVGGGAPEGGGGQ